MTFHNQKMQKFISCLLIISIIVPTVLFSIPGKAKAQIPVTDLSLNTWEAFKAPQEVSGAIAQVTSTGIAIKDVLKEIGRQVLMQIARKALQQITKSTVNWINTGYWGNPLFLENPKSFFQDIAKYEIRTLVTIFGYDSRRFPYGKDWSLNIINSYKRQLEDNAAYTLSNVINDPVLLQDYRTNFATGGWNGFLVNTQYPQNNYLGFTMLATEEAARRLDGTIQNNAEKVTATLQQGLGFLSPQNCPSNPNYNSTKNQFRTPSFKSTIKYDPPKITNFPNENAWALAMLDYDAKYQKDVAAEKTTWEKANTCPGGLVNTTPGSVVANSVITALGSNTRQTELAAAMGNSLSAVLDALVNRLFNLGLNALTTKKNPSSGAGDSWDYMGNSLGTVQPYGATTWNTGPDEEIVLDTFKKELSGKTIVTDVNGVVIKEDIGDTSIATGGEYIPGAIKNTETELKLITNNVATDPGTEQLLSAVWPKIAELDACLPGPNLGWEDRVDTEKNRNSKVLSGKINDSNGEKAAQADVALKELGFAVSYFKDWIKNKMLVELPSSILFMDAIDDLEALHQQGDELVGKKRTKIQALARLQSIKNGLDSITVQPAPGSSQEKTLIELRKQYSAIKSSASNSITIDEARAELNILKDKLSKTVEMLNTCNKERAATGWSVPGGRTSTFTPKSTGGACSYLMTSGANKKLAKVKQAMDAVMPAWKDSSDVFGFKMAVVAWLNANGETAVRGWNGNCNSSNNNLAIRVDATTAEMYEIARDGANCQPYENDPYTIEKATSCRPFGYTSTWEYQSTGKPPTNGGNSGSHTSGFTTPGTEEELFCSRPIAGGYQHDTFRTTTGTHPEIPLVNSKDVLKWRGKLGLFGHSANIQLNCKTIYKSFVTDYKKDLPGVINPQWYIDTDVAVDPGGVGGGSCSHLLSDGAGIMEADVKSAMNAVLNDPAWADSTDGRGFRDEVVSWLNSHGFKAAAGHNGNCNSSNNNLAIQVNSTTGELYDIFRESKGDPWSCNDQAPHTLGSATSCRPSGGYTGDWSYVGEGKR
ncbi:hypothetical protein HZA26_03165 [Candidatus Nomurabacteria bacterium]|nr:hypothetical protein [Candidatus Nomurabacteria bacterium]